MSFVSNRAAVFFEQKEYEMCITEVSRERYISFCVIEVSYHVNKFVRPKRYYEILSLTFSLVF